MGSVDITLAADLRDQAVPTSAKRAIDAYGQRVNTPTALERVAIMAAIAKARGQAALRVRSGR